MSAVAQPPETPTFPAFRVSVNSAFCEAIRFAQTQASTTTHLPPQSMSAEWVARYLSLTSQCREYREFITAKREQHILSADSESHDPLFLELCDREEMWVDASEDYGDTLHKVMIFAIQHSNAYLSLDRFGTNFIESIRKPLAIAGNAAKYLKEFYLDESVEVKVTRSARSFKTITVETGLSRKDGLDCPKRFFSTIFSEHAEDSWMSRMKRTAFLVAASDHPGLEEFWVGSNDGFSVVSWGQPLNEHLKNTVIDERQTRLIFTVLLSALAQLKRINLNHHNLTTKTVVIANPSGDYSAKITDFSLSQFYGEPFAGAHPLSVAPEGIRSSTRSNKGDVFSFGLLGFSLLYGKDILPEVVAKRVSFTLTGIRNIRVRAWAKPAEYERTYLTPAFERLSIRNARMYRDPTGALSELVRSCLTPNANLRPSPEMLYNRIRALPPIESV